MTGATARVRVDGADAGACAAVEVPPGGRARHRAGDRRGPVVRGRSPAGSSWRRCWAPRDRHPLRPRPARPARRRRAAAGRCAAAGRRRHRWTRRRPRGCRALGTRMGDSRRRPSGSSSASARAPTGSPTRRVDALLGSTYTVEPDEQPGRRPADRCRPDPRGDRRTAERGHRARGVQVPADGQPLVFLADHPTTGGYPVIGVVDAVDLRCSRRRVRATTVRLPWTSTLISAKASARWRLGDDEALLDMVTSANVACGFHAGDPATMRRVCARGGGPGRRGRRPGGLPRPGRVRPPADRLRPRRAARRVLLPDRRAGRRSAGSPATAVRYVKPHGALYNTAAVDEVQASAVVAAVGTTTGRCRCCASRARCWPGSRPRPGLRVVGEGFADRGYRPDGRLVPRSAARRAGRRPTRGGGRARGADGRRAAWSSRVDGAVVPAPVESICVHGDTPGAVALARRCARRWATPGCAGAVRRVAGRSASPRSPLPLSPRRGRGGPAGGGRRRRRSTRDRDAPVLPGEVAGGVLGVGVAGGRLRDDLQDAARDVAR